VTKEFSQMEIWQLEAQARLYKRKCIKDARDDLKARAREAKQDKPKKVRKNA